MNVLAASFSTGKSNIPLLFQFANRRIYRLLWNKAGITDITLQTSIPHFTYCIKNIKSTVGKPESGGNIAVDLINLFVNTIIFLKLELIYGVAEKFSFIKTPFKSPKSYSEYYSPKSYLCQLLIYLFACGKIRIKKCYC